MPQCHRHDALLRCLFRVNTRDRAAANDRDAIAHAENSGSSDEIITRPALFGELLHQRVNFGFRTTSTPWRFIEHEHRRRDRQQPRKRNLLFDCRRRVTPHPIRGPV